MTCSTYFRKREFYEVYVFPMEKQRCSRFDTFISLCFVDDCLMIFRHRFLHGLFMILGAILAPFSMPFRTFGNHSGILFRYRFFHDCLMPFWNTFGPKSLSRGGIRSNIIFKKKKTCFFWASIWASIFYGV